jgi:hypothetical protein
MINWMLGKNVIDDLDLSIMGQWLKVIFGPFLSIHYKHIFQEHNISIGRLSKYVLNLQEHLMVLLEFLEGDVISRREECIFRQAFYVRTFDVIVF